MSPIRAVADGVHLSIVVQPRASTSAIQGLHQGAIKIRVTAPPVDGAANEAVIHTLARALEVPRGAVRIVRGARGRRKTVAITGITPAQAARALGLSAAPGPEP